MSTIGEKVFLATGGPIAGAGIATAVAGLIAPGSPVSLAVPIAASLLTFVALKTSGALDNPDKVLIEPRPKTDGVENTDRRR